MGLELADIFRQYGPAYRQKYSDQILPSYRQAMRAIEQCRNRHCPKCQNDKAQEWLETQQDLLLPVPYFMLTFTLPAALCEVVRSHQNLLYNLLFRVSAAATQHLAQDPRFVGGQIGLVGILHTWGRNLAYHPHIHYLVPAGGLAAGTPTWLPAQQDWVVHCKAVGNGRTALKYLAPYVFRVAISNRRLVKLENDQVTFRYRATDTGQLKLCTLSAEAFIHRFLQHVLPKGFVKVRYFGFFAPGCRNRLLALRQQLEHVDPENIGQSETAPPDATPVPKLCCPSCGQPLLFQRTIQPTGRCPPYFFTGGSVFALAPMFQLVSKQKIFVQNKFSPDFWLVLVGFSDVQSISVHQFDCGSDLACALNSKWSGTFPKTA